VKTVTALRERARGRVEVDLDGSLWRTLPVDAVVRSELVVGRTLDRETARALARELRRSHALRDAARALRHRDLSRRALAGRLPAPGRDDALAALERSGILDDRRAAAGRATVLSGRGYGDAAIRFRLEQEGFSGEDVAEALAALEPEHERAKRLVERGRAPRWLAARGFDVPSPESGPHPPGTAEVADNW
jgi:SOS response regulatory protein OraA/RecX